MRERGTVRREKEDRGTEVCVGGRGGRGVGRGDKMPKQKSNTGKTYVKYGANYQIITTLMGKVLLL